MSGPAADAATSDPVEVAIAAVRAGFPAGRSLPDVLEVGSGTGVFAQRLRRECPEVALLATDASPRLVELARERGVPAQVMDAQLLLPGDASYDVVVAMWVLHLVPDLDRALAELRRVLRPGGRLVAVTDGEATGEAALLRHFDAVEREDVAWDPPADGWPREHAGHVTVFVARVAGP